MSFRDEDFTDRVLGQYLQGRNPSTLNREEVKWLRLRIEKGLPLPPQGWVDERTQWTVVTPTQSRDDNMKSSIIAEAKKQIKELTETLERVQKEPLVLYTIQRMSKDKKYAFIKKQDQELRIEASPNLQEGHEVLLHPKTLQIVEALGFPPLEASPFSPPTIPNVLWDDIGGLKSAKDAMIEAIELPHKHKELYDYYNKRPVKGILLAGPPGCGKTMLAKAAATSLANTYGKQATKTGYLYVKGPEILNQYVGQTEQTIRDMFQAARQHKQENHYPAIIFLDEADSILPARGQHSSGITNSIVAQFLTEMDGLTPSDAIVIIATNRPDILDPAVVRDGRCDRKVTVSRPDINNATTILKLALRNVPTEKGSTTLNEIAEEMALQIYSPERFIRDKTPLSSIVSGAMLTNCVDLAISNAITRDIMNNTKTGLTIDDAICAIDRMQDQSYSVNHQIEMTITLKETGGS